MPPYTVTGPGPLADLTMCDRAAAARLTVNMQHATQRKGMSMNWLEGMTSDMMAQPGDLTARPGRPMSMPVFAGQKLVVVGGERPNEYELA